MVGSRFEILWVVVDESTLKFETKFGLLMCSSGDRFPILPTFVRTLTFAANL